MRRRTISPTFETFTERLQFAFCEGRSDPIDMTQATDETVRSTSHEHQIEIRDILAKALSDGSADTELAAMWSGGRSNYVIRLHDPRSFYAAILDSLNRRLAEKEKERRQAIRPRHGR